MTKKSTLPENREFHDIKRPQHAVYEGAAGTAEVKAKPPRKVRLTTMVGAEVVAKVRDAVYSTPGLTVAALVEGALVDKLKHLEDERGEPFPEATGQLPVGRPHAFAALAR